MTRVRRSLSYAPPPRNSDNDISCDLLIFDKKDVRLSKRKQNAPGFKARSRWRP